MAPVIRKDVNTLSDADLDILIDAFERIQKLSPGEPDQPNKHSFYVIAGLHGQPFRGAGYGNSAWWGGYCHHGNVLFPTWHRAYVRHLEEALQSEYGDDNIAMPYWNQLDPSNKVPEVLLKKKHTFRTETKNHKKGDIIDNPLFSYKLQQGFFDNLKRTVSGNGTTKALDYSKDKDYETVRCPYSGLVGPTDKDATKAHNAGINAQNQLDPNFSNNQLNSNVNKWLTDDAGIQFTGIRARYHQALLAPNYTVFSNTTSAGKWNDDNMTKVGTTVPTSAKLVYSLESPHNGIHLAVGGYDLPDRNQQAPKPPSGANGDMGENDTAAFDPIFFFHHCFVDLVFWSWQVHQKAESKLSIIPYYPGTSSVDAQGPTPGIGADTQLAMDTPLRPFMSGDREMTSQDVVNIEVMKYKYDHVIQPARFTTPDLQPSPIVRVSGINRASIAGSFVVQVTAKAPNSDEKIFVGIEPVFSRWHVNSCDNCQNFLSVTAHMPLPASIKDEKLEEVEFNIAAYRTKDDGSKGLVDIPFSAPHHDLSTDVGKIRY